MEKRSVDNEIQKYFAQKKEVQEAILQFLQNSSEDEINFHILTHIICQHKITEEKGEFEHFLYLILSVSNNCHREAGFFMKIEQIIIFYKEQIKQTFSNYEIFNLFESSKPILLILFENEMITIDELILKDMLIERNSNGERYCHFFIPEIKKQISKEKFAMIDEEFFNFESKNLDDHYNEKRHQGENDSYTSSLIRNDSVEEFISHYNYSNFSLTNKIKPSIYETNSFLINKNPTLIEYSAFYGSIQIFEFLLSNNVELTPSLWLYSIHSNNPELIYILEENQIKPEDETYMECFNESIKCHHIDLAKYFLNNYLTYKNSQLYIEKNAISSAFESNNYYYFPKSFKYSFEFYYLSKYKYSKVVNLFLEMKLNSIENFIKEKALSKKSIIYQSASKNETITIYYLLLKSTEIAIKLFEDCKKIKFISIPPTFKTIRKCAFFGCSSLIKISIPDSVTSIESNAFRECKSLIEIEIPKSITAIESFAFDGCLKLEKINIPNSVKSIGECAFFGCRSLKEIFLPFSVTSIEDHAFHGCRSLTYISIPSSVTSIGKGTFKECESLTQISIPSSIKIITSYAFDECLKLEEIKIPSSITTISKCAFRRCISIAQISIPSSVISIEDSAFIHCSSLTRIIIPSSIKSIGNNAFSQCSSLIQIAIPFSITSIGNNAFYQCSSLEQISFENPSNLQVIGSNAFAKSAIESITIPKMVTTIHDRAFYQCNNLKLIQFEDDSKLSFIGESAFMHTSIKNISIPRNVKIIKKNTFAYTELNNIEFSSDSQLTTIESEAFNNSDLKEIYLPSKVENLCEGWCEFLNDIKKINVSPDNCNFISIDGKILIGKSNKIEGKFDVLYFVNFNVENKILSILESINPIETSILLENDEDSNLSQILHNTQLIDDFFKDMKINDFTLRFNYYLSKNQNKFDKTSKLKSNFINIGNGITFSKSSPQEENFDVLYSVNKELNLIFIPSTIKYINSCLVSKNTIIKTIEIKDEQNYEIDSILIDLPSQYTSMINTINDEMINRIYSKFAFKYYKFNDQSDVNNIIFNLFLYLVNFKFITFCLFDKNCTFCIEDECIIVENISEFLINDLINKLVKYQIILINVSNASNTSIEPNERAINEIFLFCTHFDDDTLSNEFVNYTINSIIGYLINRYYCKPEYFMDKSFLYFDFINGLNELEIKTKLKDYLSNENDSSSLNDVFNEIKSFNFNQNKKECKLKFQKSDFFVLRDIYFKDHSISYLVFHIQSFHILLMKKLSDKNENLSSQSSQFYGFYCENENIIGKLYKLNVNELFENDSLYSYTEFRIIDQSLLLLRFAYQNLFMNYYIHNNLTLMIHHNVSLMNLTIMDNDIYDTNIVQTSDFQFTRNMSRGNSLNKNLFDILPKKYTNENLSYPANNHRFDLFAFNLFKKFDYSEMVNTFYNYNKEYFSLNSKDISGANFNDEINLFLFFKQNLMNNEIEENLYETIDFIANFIYIQQNNEYLFYFHDQIQEFKNLLLIKTEKNKAFNFMIIGIFYYYGYGLEQNYTEAKNFFELSLKYNNSKHFNDLLCNCENSHISDQNYLEIVQYFKHMRITINSFNYLYIGNLYYYGYGVEQDYSKAKEYYENSSYLGNSIARTLLSIKFAEFKK